MGADFMRKSDVSGSRVRVFSSRSLCLCASVRDCLVVPFVPTFLGGRNDPEVVTGRTGRSFLSRSHGEHGGLGSPFRPSRRFILSM